MANKCNLERFVLAQENSYDEVKSELRSGQKQSHWMWFVFPQIRGLGYSDIAQKYGISCTEEANAYVTHPILGSRLIECCNLILDIQGRNAHYIFGETDAMKLRSSMTLFSRSSDNPVFCKVLSKYYDDKEDIATLELLDEAKL
ncbi:MAG: hypothetical protein ACI9LU_000562 [Polaribacter sp.]|jgi:uncharacterized protein (DUF1810 family)